MTGHGWWWDDETTHGRRAVAFLGGCLLLALWVVALPLMVGLVLFSMLWVIHPLAPPLAVMAVICASPVVYRITKP